MLRASRSSAGRISARDPNPFTAPLSRRYDELDGQMWLEDVHIPWERVFLVDPSPETDGALAVLAPALLLVVEGGIHAGLALACTHAMGLMAHDPTSTICSI